MGGDRREVGRMEKLNLLKEIKEFTVVKFRNEEIAIALKNNKGDLIGKTKDNLQTRIYTTVFASDRHPTSFDSNLQHNCNSHYDVVAYKNYSNSATAFRNFLNEDVEDWTWDRKESVEMTVEELLKMATEQLGEPVVLKEEK